MPKVKLLRFDCNPKDMSYYDDSYEHNKNIIIGSTPEWEDITQEEYIELSRNLGILNKTDKCYYHIIVEDVSKNIHEKLTNIREYVTKEREKLDKYEAQRKAKAEEKKRKAKERALEKAKKLLEESNVS
jgi:hypothetical protein